MEKLDIIIKTVTPAFIAGAMEKNETISWTNKEGKRGKQTGSIPPNRHGWRWSPHTLAAGNLALLVQGKRRSSRLPSIG